MVQFQKKILYFFSIIGGGGGVRTFYGIFHNIFKFFFEPFPNSPAIKNVSNLICVWHLRDNKKLLVMGHGWGLFILTFNASLNKFDLSLNMID